MSEDDEVRKTTDWDAVARGGGLLGLGLIFWGVWLFEFPLALIVLGSLILVDSWFIRYRRGG